MRVRLTRRLAERINGVDLSHHAVGDLIDLPQHDAQLLVAEGWALAVQSERRQGERRGVRADAANGSAPGKRKPRM